MTNDIEAAARAVIEAWDRPLLGAYAETMHEAVSHLRSALAHAARGEGGPPPWHAPCVLCGHRQSAHNTDTGPCSKCGCDCAAFRPTPPPATGEAGTHGPGKCLPVDGVEFDRAVASREQDERERWIRADERERCAKWHDERAETSGNERSAWWHKDCAAALRALPEAREGKS